VWRGGDVRRDRRVARLAILFAGAFFIGGRLVDAWRSWHLWQQTVATDPSAADLFGAVLHTTHRRPSVLLARLTVAVLSLSAAGTAVALAQGACQSYPASARGTALDLAPFPGLVEVCSRDTALCRQLTAGYPPNVATLGYFVPAGDWEAYRQQKRSFTHYLIAQAASNLAPPDFGGFKQFVRERQGQIPDNTKLPATLAARGQVPLGVFDETARSISFGTLMQLSRETPSGPVPLTLAVTNSGLVLKDRVLSLYVYREYRSPEDVQSAKAETLRWLACLRTAN